MDKLLAFGDSVLKGVIYENEHYKVNHKQRREDL